MNTKTKLSTRVSERLFTIIEDMRKKRIREEQLFKNNFRLYVVTYYNTHAEIWSHAQKQGYLPKSILCGRIRNGKLTKPLDFYEFDYLVMKSAERAFRLLGI